MSANNLYVGAAVAQPDGWRIALRRHQLAAIAGLIALFAFRLWYIHLHQLVSDEAVYWQWSRHLQWGYLDHPPLLAGLIRASTTLLGTSEFSVRLPMALLAWGSFAVVIALTQALYRETKLTILVAVIWLTSPLWNALGLLATPDTPSFFFSTCALGCGLMAIRNGEGSWWIAAGISTGLALQSKYTAVLLPAAVFGALLSSREGRRVLRNPWPWVSGIIAVAIFSPVIWWNAQHSWVSFAFQLHHGEDATQAAPLKGLGAFVGGQALLWTPVLFVIGLVVLAKSWRRIRSATLSDRILVFAGTLPLIFFGYSSTRSHSEMNWPGFAYVPISLLTAKFVAEKWDARIGWARIGCIVALFFTIMLHVPELILKTGVQPPSLTEPFDSRSFASFVEQNSAGETVVCNRHQDAAIASFYMTGRPDIWAVSCGSRPTAFDYMDSKPDLRNYPSVTFVGWHTEKFCSEYGFEPTPGKTLEVPSIRKKKRYMLITTLHRVAATQPSAKASAK